MPEWEYITISLNEVPTSTDVIDVLNVAGKDGWELVVITGNNIAYMKRHIRKRAKKSTPPAAPSTP
jgi:hypothetical protein